MGINLLQPLAQLKTLLPNILKLFIPASLILLLVVLVRVMTGIEIVNFTRDPADIMEINPFFGAVSNIGVLLWCAAATTCFLTATILHQQERDVAIQTFLNWSGSLTLLLLVDDLFMLHESLRDYLGIPERLTFAIYGLLSLLYLIKFGKKILRTDYMLLLIGFGFLGLSMGVDSLQDLIQPLVPGYALFEDGLKLFGIVGWFGYFARFALQTLAPIQNR